MPQTTLWMAFAMLSLGMVLTPGPNMLYLLSRAISQGPMAGIISLIGTAGGFVFYLFGTSFGITKVFLVAPLAFYLLKGAGAAYLAWLAWQAIRPGGQSPFQLVELPKDPPGRLMGMGLLTNLLNPKAALLYLSLLPQFIDPTRGEVFAQSLILGGTQIAISVTVNAILCLAAGSIAAILAGRPLFALLQRWLMATVLGGLAVRMAMEPQPRL